jgi:hypothetical protein
MKPAFRSPLSLQTFSSKRQWFSHCGAFLTTLRNKWERTSEKWTDWPNLYGLFKFSARQTEALREEVAQLSSWKELETWLNQNLDILYANPMVWFDEEVTQRKRVIRIEFIGGTTEDVGAFFDFTEFEADYDLTGQAHVMRMKVWHEMGNQKRPGRFEMRYFKDAMVCFGMIPTGNADYQPAGSDPRGEHTDAHYEISFAFPTDFWRNLPKPPALPGTDEWFEENQDTDWEDEQVWGDTINDDPKDDILESWKKIITE